MRPSENPGVVCGAELGDSVFPVAGLAAAMHDGVDANPSLLGFPAVVKHVGKTVENVAADARLINHSPPSRRSENAVNGGLDSGDESLELRPQTPPANGNWWRRRTREALRGGSRKQASASRAS